MSGERMYPTADSPPVMTLRSLVQDVAELRAQHARALGLLERWAAAQSQIAVGPGTQAGSGGQSPASIRNAALEEAAELIRGKGKHAREEAGRWVRKDCPEMADQKFTEAAAFADLAEEITGIARQLLKSGSSSGGGT